MTARKGTPPPDTTGLSVLAQRFSVQAAPEPEPAGGELIPLDDIAFNPLNGRRMSGPRWEAKVAELAASFADNGQVEACAIVTRAAFLAIFDEYEAQIGAAPYVHVTGSRRHTAAARLGWETLRVDVRDEFAVSRSKFLDATGTENITREALTATEQARQLLMMVKEHGGSQAAVARRLGKTPAWVTQQLNLLKLAPEVQAALDEGVLRPGSVRDWHRLPDFAAQLARLTAYRRGAHRLEALTAVNDDDAEPPAERPARASRVTVAVRNLGGTPEKIAASLRAEMPAAAIKELVEYLIGDPLGDD